jgi:hypothetical protein
MNETTYYGVATTITNLYLGCGSTKFYIYRIVSQQVIYLTDQFSRKYQRNEARFEWN